MSLNIRVETEELAAEIIGAARKIQNPGRIAHDVINGTHRIIVVLTGIPPEYEIEWLAHHNPKVAAIFAFCAEWGNCRVMPGGECVDMKLSVDPALMPMRVW